MSLIHKLFNGLLTRFFTYKFYVMQWNETLILNEFFNFYFKSRNLESTLIEASKEKLTFSIDIYLTLCRNHRRLWFTDI